MIIFGYWWIQAKESEEREKEERKNAAQASSCQSAGQSNPTPAKHSTSTKTSTHEVNRVDAEGPVELVFAGRPQPTGDFGVESSLDIRDFKHTEELPIPDFASLVKVRVFLFCLLFR